MDSNIEIDFVKKYIKKEYQDRLLFELQSKKHREKALSRFSHSSETVLKDCFKKCNMSELKKNLRDLLDSKEKCYIISSDVNDGEILSLKDAIECCEKSYMVVILVFQKFVVVKEEFEKKEPLVFISN